MTPPTDAARKDERPYRYWSAVAGFWNPVMSVQFHPLAWGIGIGLGGGKVALEVGPVSVAVWFVSLKWSNTIQKGRSYVD